MFYIGSSYVTKVKSGYHGSIKSKKYKTVFDLEIKQNPQLFKTKIIKTFLNRADALASEYKLQTQFNVVKSPMYLNQSVAAKNGCFGMDTSGKNNPNFGKNHSNKTKEKIRIARSTQENNGENNGFFDKHHSQKTKDHLSKIRLGTKQPRCSCIKCKKDISINNITNHLKACKHKELIEPIMITCQHCNLTAKRGSNMNRWHFDNCKMKK